MKYFGNGTDWGLKIKYSFERQPLGTAGGIRNVIDCLPSAFLLWFGDILANIDVNRMWEVHARKRSELTLAILERNDVSASGIAELQSDGRVTRFAEKPHSSEVFSKCVFGGLAIVEPKLFTEGEFQGLNDFSRDLIPALVSGKRRVFGVKLFPRETIWWIDTPSDLQYVRSVLTETHPFISELQSV